MVPGGGGGALQLSVPWGVCGPCNRCRLRFPPQPWSLPLASHPLAWGLSAENSSPQGTTRNKRLTVPKVGWQSQVHGSPKLPGSLHARVPHGKNNAFFVGSPPLPDSFFHFPPVLARISSQVNAWGWNPHATWSLQPGKMEEGSPHFP